MEAWEGGEAHLSGLDAGVIGKFQVRMVFAELLPDPCCSAGLLLEIGNGGRRHGQTQM